jgi:predicted Fe-Mo cluster-binding NifX family protein
LYVVKMEAEEMRVAIPTWNGRVSPLFDTATRMAIAEVDGPQIGPFEERPISETFPPWRVRALSDIGVEVLICGGISRPLAAMVGAAGIRVVPWVTGEVQTVLQAYAQGRIPAPQFQMPGRRGRGRRFRGGPRPWWR